MYSNIHSTYIYCSTQIHVDFVFHLENDKIKYCTHFVTEACCCWCWWPVAWATPRGTSQTIRYRSTQPYDLPDYQVLYVHIHPSIWPPLQEVQVQEKRCHPYKKCKKMHHVILLINVGLPLSWAVSLPLRNSGEQK